LFIVSVTSAAFGEAIAVAVAVALAEDDVIVGGGAVLVAGEGKEAAEGAGDDVAGETATAGPPHPVIKRSTASPVAIITRNNLLFSMRSLP
jgi:hypothetical protein